jgi:hypothetical protein
MRYIESKYSYLSDGILPIEVHKRSKKRTITEAFNAIDTANNRTFNRGVWQTSYTQWIASSGVSLRQATSDDFYNLLT